MDDRMLLHHIDLKRGVVHIDGKDYTLKDTNWPTLDPKDPYRLSIEEEDLIRKILHSFESSEKMKKHMRCSSGMGECIRFVIPIYCFMPLSR